MMYRRAGTSVENARLILERGMISRVVKRDGKEGRDAFYFHEKLELCVRNQDKAKLRLDVSAFLEAYKYATFYVPRLGHLGERREGVMTNGIDHEENSSRSWIPNEFFTLVNEA